MSFHGHCWPLPGLEFLITDPSHDVVFFQSRRPHIHRVTDRLRHEIPRVVEHGPPRPCDEELPRRRLLQGQDLRLRHESKSVQLRLPEDRGQGNAAHTVDGVGGDSVGKYKLSSAETM